MSLFTLSTSTGTVAGAVRGAGNTAGLLPPQESSARHRPSTWNFLSKGEQDVMGGRKRSGSEEGRELFSGGQLMKEDDVDVKLESKREGATSWLCYAETHQGDPAWFL